MLGRGHLRVLQFPRRIDSTQAGIHLGLGDIKTNRLDMLAELHHQWQTDIAQTDHSYDTHRTLPRKDSEL